MTSDNPIRDEQDEAFRQAAIRGDLAFIAECLGRGMDVNVSEALMMAIRECHVELIPILLDHGADLTHENCIEFTAMTYAIITSRPWSHIEDYFSVPRPDPRPLEMLLAAGGKYRLLEAVLLNDVPLARLRLDEGASPNTGQLSYYGPVLKIAAELGYLEMVDLLLDRGADIEAIDDLGQRPLLSAAWYGQIEVVLRLLARGAELNAVSWSGQSALSNAAISGHKALFELLLSQGATRNVVDAFAVDDLPLFEELMDKESESNGDVDSLFDGRYRLAILAARRGQTAALRLLLDRGASHFRQWSDDRTLLAEATCHGHLETARLLLDHGADPNEVGKDGRTPLEIAIQCGYNEIADLLKQSSSLHS